MIEFAQSFGRRKLIYLDTKFWIKLCNAELRQPKSSPEDHSLLARVCESVTSGKAVYPFSTPVWFETFHQTDPQTRLATAQLIDELPLGLTCLPEDERIATELGILFRASAFKKPVTQLAARLIWAVPFCGLGIPFVESDAWAEPDAVSDR
jgi:hypothetical protein